MDTMDNACEVTQISWTSSFWGEGGGWISMNYKKAEVLQQPYTVANIPVKPTPKPHALHVFFHNIFGSYIKCLL